MLSQARQEGRRSRRKLLEMKASTEEEEGTAVVDTEDTTDDTRALTLVHLQGPLLLLLLGLGIAVVIFVMEFLLTKDRLSCFQFSTSAC